MQAQPLAVARDSRRRRRGARRPGPCTAARPLGRTWRVAGPLAGSGPARDEPDPGAASPPEPPSRLVPRLEPVNLAHPTAAAPLGRLERPAYGLGNRRSIHLSYRGVT